MDISTAYHDRLNISLSSNSDYHISGTSLDSRAGTDIPIRNQQEAPKTMMDLEEMTDFLFMMIGSKIRIEPDVKNTGEQVDRLA